METETTVPVRSFMDDANIQWREGKPNYVLINAKYMKERTKQHKEGSLEKIVENLVKTWEMESTHKTRAKDWGTIAPGFYIRVNGGEKYDINDNIEKGNYNLFLKGSPLYDVCKEGRDSAQDMFHDAFPGGFAWEVLEVFSGPPRISFTWRHWADWTGTIRGVKPTGESLELFGSCVAEVTADLKIKSIEIFFDPNQMMSKLTGFGCRHMGK